MLTKRALLTFALALLAVLSAGSRSLAAEGPKMVLVLYSEDRANLTMATTDTVIRSTFRQGSGQIQIFNEYLDNMRISTENYERGLVAFLREKYQDQKFNLIIAVGEAALLTLNKNGETLFPGVPVVFAGLVRRNFQPMNVGANTTGVKAYLEGKPTLDLALQLHPDTRQVVVVAGDANFDKLFLADWRQEFSDEKRVEFTYLDGLGIEELQQKLAQLPDHTIILYLNFGKDPAGNRFTNRESLALFAPHSAAPIYGVWELGFGYGTVGGQLISGETGLTLNHQG